MIAQKRPLGLVKEIINSIGLDISYAYDDLVFVDHSLIIIQFDDESFFNIDIYFNENCEKTARANLMDQIKKEAVKREMKASEKGTFSLKEKSESEELEIAFYQKK